MAQRIQPKKSLGQHFLVDKNIARKIVALVQPQKGDVIVEIGPGKGILTQFFLQTPAEVVAIEIDSRLVGYLQARFGDHPRLRIVAADFREVDFARLDLPPGRIKWAGNLPYNLTSVVFFRLLEEVSRVHRAVFMVQREVAERVVAGAGNRDYGILSVLLQTFFAVKFEFPVSKKVFRPMPEVESAVISLENHHRIDLNCSTFDLVNLVKRSFNQRRKVLRNALRKWLSLEVQNELGFNFDRRPEEVPVEEWKELCQLLSKKGIRIPPLSGSSPQ